MKARRIVVVGGGFAGLWAALLARKEIEEAGGEIAVTLVSKDDQLTLRPRLYEPRPERFRVPLRPLLDEVGATFIAGTVARLDLERRRVALDDGARDIDYDRLVLAAGSVLAPLPVPGGAACAFNLDTWDAAMALERHLGTLLAEPARPGRDTVIIVGAGFTGIEIATEMRHRIAAHAGAARAAAARIVLLERAAAVAPELGDNPRPVIEAALAEAKVEVHLGASVTAIDDGGLSLADGRRFEGATVVIANGLRASPLTRQLPVAHDELGRAPVDEMLRVVGLDGVYASGDVAHARVDEAGHVALMSCQHAMTMGRFAGYNAARDLLGLPLRPYRQERYVTCLDLGASGAVFTRGWSREVEKTGAEAKRIKHLVNREIIYPPSGDKARILAAATLTPEHHRRPPERR